ncbi:MAG: DNA-directed RNA polymerase subunit beta [Nitrospirae bacterium]|nr:DNA-directed RNA polymerase subunit beta [Nitrospirota bacterium]
MSSALKGRRYRRSFGRIKPLVDIPDLIEIQRKSYADFLQAATEPEKRRNVGLQKAFKSIFPIENYERTASIEFVKYKLLEPKYDIDECRIKGASFASPMRVTFRLALYDLDPETKQKSTRVVKEDEIYFGEIPLITDRGTFIINGVERVVVNQLHRSPGCLFDRDKNTYIARLIPSRGSWLDFEFDSNDILYVRIDGRRKIPATVLLKALGFTAEFLLEHFYPVEEIVVDGKKLVRKIREQFWASMFGDLKDSRNLANARRKVKMLFDPQLQKQKDFEEMEIPVTASELKDRITAREILNPKTKETLAKTNEALTSEKIEEIVAAGVEKFHVIYVDSMAAIPSMQKTIASDKVQTHREAIIDIYRKLRITDVTSEEIAMDFFHNMFFNPERYDLSRVGRHKLNMRLRQDVPVEHTTLRKEDVLGVVEHLIRIKMGAEREDDVDHLGNRRVRSVGELVEGQFRSGLMRLSRSVKERLSGSGQEIDTLMPRDIINIKPVMASLREFYYTGQLSQFMDQTNPLSEVTHKRRLSALGAGGLTRERAGFEVRDVHPSHYGRICPIETPEGQNIGLIVSLSTYARTNEFGFLETPYMVVKDSRTTGEVKYLTALEEEQYVISQANNPLDKHGRFTSDLITARSKGEFAFVKPEEVHFMDVSPNQLISVGAGLIPFLEHDDANRALMGCNMQRQAVPLIRPEAPLVGTGMEPIVARDSGSTIMSKRDGVVEYVDSSRIVIRSKKPVKDINDSGVDIYNLTKFKRSNQNTCINQKSIVLNGQKVVAGQVVADGMATEGGDLALGKNALVAFMPWRGFNFEDSIVISERMVREDHFTSIHIEEFECAARDTKLGPEEITRDIPDVGEELLKNLDESGIVRIGAEVKPSDILVGKITPKSETQLSSDERLMRAIFGEKGRDVKNMSLTVPPGIYGTVIDARVFTRKGVSKDLRAQAIEQDDINKLEQDRQDEIRIIQENALSQVRPSLVGKVAKDALKNPKKRQVYVNKGEKISDKVLDEVPFELLGKIELSSEESQEELQQILERSYELLDLVNSSFDKKIEKIRSGDELQAGVVKLVKVYVAVKRKLAVGDKMAGRHGNKGVVSIIAPVEDMPIMEDGTSIDIVLNPLGVPSRMNVGQILETHLGWASHELGRRIEAAVREEKAVDDIRAILADIHKEDREVCDWLKGATQKEIMEFALGEQDGIHLASPVFDGAGEADIEALLKRSGLPVEGQVTLFDGRTGEPFAQKVTVGIMYMMKLHHLVDDKIHARSVGGYSLVTQQPLGGKAHFGGQRLGEMEVWALEAYGAAHTLQEFLTVKSDDVTGRNRVYQAIVKGQTEFDIGMPESFNVLVKELQGLGLNIELLSEEA